MNREIKFRAWDSEQKVMFYGEKEQFDDMLAFRFGHFGIDPEENVFYMQFTGLKDENKVNIYEDDVVVDNVGRIWIVKYSENKASFLFHWVKDQSQYVNMYGFNAFQKPIEVIGNVHQNPEML